MLSTIHGLKPTDEMVPGNAVLSFFSVKVRGEQSLKGVILAAGKGTRLYPVTLHIPKPILPLANRPTIEYAFDRLKELGIDNICIVVGEAEAQMRAALGHGRDFDVRLTYVRQRDPHGLAHALGFAEE